MHCDKEDPETYKNKLIAKDAFTEDEEFNMCVGLTLAVMIYDGVDSQELEICTFLTFDETVPASAVE